MDRIPCICTYKDEAYVIHLHRGMKLDAILSDVCNRWTLDSEKVELKCVIPERPNSKMRMTSEDDVDRMIDMHVLLSSKIMNVEVHIIRSDECGSIRTSSAPSIGCVRIPSCGSNNNLCISENNTLSQEGSKFSDLWYDIIHSVGQTFNSVDHVRSELTRFAIARGFDYIYTKNDLSRVTVKCKIVDCSWHLHAIRVGGGPFFEIKRLHNVHTCGGGLSTQKHPRASKKWVGSIIREKIADTPLYRPKDIKKDIFREYGVDVPYYQAWLGKEFAYKEIHGDERCSFDSQLYFYFSHMHLAFQQGTGTMYTLPCSVNLPTFYAIKMWLAGFSRGIQEMHRKASLVLEDAVRNIYTVVAFCAGNKVMELYRSQLRKIFTKSFLHGMAIGFGFGLSQFLLFACNALLLWYTAVSVKDGRLTRNKALKEYMVFSFATFALVEPFGLAPYILKRRNSH